MYETMSVRKEGREKDERRNGRKGRKEEKVKRSCNVNFLVQ